VMNLRIEWLHLLFLVGVNPLVLGEGVW
jgi:hypothetical protein